MAQGGLDSGDGIGSFNSEINRVSVLTLSRFLSSPIPSSIFFYISFSMLDDVDDSWLFGRFFVNFHPCKFYHLYEIMNFLCTSFPLNLNIILSYNIKVAQVSVKGSNSYKPTLIVSGCLKTSPWLQSPLIAACYENGHLSKPPTVTSIIDLIFQIKEMVDNPANIGKGQHRHSAEYAGVRRLMVSRHRINVSRTSTLLCSEVITGTPLCGLQLDVASLPLVRNQKRNIDATL